MSENTPNWGVFCYTYMLKKCIKSVYYLYKMNIFHYLWEKL